MYLVFSLYFAVEGIIYPFWPVWLASHGYSNAEVALLIAASYWPQTVVALSLAYMADWKFSQLRIAAASALFSCICLAAFYGGDTYAAHLWLSIAFGGAWASVLPLSESSLLGRDKAALVDYGYVRASGSIAFIALSTIGGLLISKLGVAIIPGVVAALMGMTGLSCFRMSRGGHRTGEAPNHRARPSLLLVLRCRPVVAAACTGSLIQVSHALYFAVASNSWKAVGYTPTQIGLFWAVAVSAEIVFFAVSGRILQSVTPRAIICLSGVVAALRWTLYALDTQIVTIVSGQLLHALSFAAYHVAMMRVFRDFAPAGSSAIVQGTYYSFLVALPMGLFTPVAGWAFDHIGNLAYLPMACLAIVGALVAFAVLPRHRFGVSHDG